MANCGSQPSFAHRSHILYRIVRDADTQFWAAIPGQAPQTESPTGRKVHDVTKSTAAPVVDCALTKAKFKSLPAVQRTVWGSKPKSGNGDLEA